MGSLYSKMVWWVSSRSIGASSGSAEILLADGAADGAHAVEDRIEIGREAIVGDVLRAREAQLRHQAAAELLGLVREDVRRSSAEGVQRRADLLHAELD